MSTAQNGDGQGEGAILDEAQIKRLKIAIAIMSALLVAGIVTLIARVIYLANRGDASLATPAAGAALQASLHVKLPQGADVKSTSLQGNRLLVHYSTPAAAGLGQAEGLIILDLATGKQSHVSIGNSKQF